MHCLRCQSKEITKDPKRNHFYYCDSCKKYCKILPCDFGKCNANFENVEVKESEDWFGLYMHCKCDDHRYAFDQRQTDSKYKYDYNIDRTISKKQYLKEKEEVE